MSSQNTLIQITEVLFFLTSLYICLFGMGRDGKDVEGKSTLLLKLNVVYRDLNFKAWLQCLNPDHWNDELLQFILLDIRGPKGLTNVCWLLGKRACPGTKHMMKPLSTCTFRGWNWVTDTGQGRSFAGTCKEFRLTRHCTPKFFSFSSTSYIWRTEITLIKQKKTEGVSFHLRSNSQPLPLFRIYIT